MSATWTREHPGRIYTIGERVLPWEWRQRQYSPDRGSLGGQEQELGEYKYSRRVFRGSSRGTAGHRVTPNGVHFACVYAMLRVFSGGCVGPQKRLLNHLSYVQFVSGAPNEITLASYCQRSLQQHHVRYTVHAGPASCVRHEYHPRSISIYASSAHPFSPIRSSNTLAHHAQLPILILRKRTSLRKQRPCRSETPRTQEAA